MFGSLLNVAVNTVTAPVRVAADTLDVADGILQGEVRTKAIESLGKEAISNLTQAELLELANL